jgi:hypothetical protein
MVKLQLQLRHMVCHLSTCSSVALATCEIQTAVLGWALLVPVKARLFLDVEASNLPLAA